MSKINNTKHKKNESIFKMLSCTEHDKIYIHFMKISSIYGYSLLNYKEIRNLLICGWLSNVVKMFTSNTHKKLMWISDKIFFKV